MPIDVEKRVLKSHLTAMQARVEPQFLRNALAQVEYLYDIDAQAADRVLKELIAYLRAAIPQIRDPASTLAREVQLANAYLNIVGTQSKDWLVVNGTGTPIADGARMPPMIVLPSSIMRSRIALSVRRATNVSESRWLFAMKSSCSQSATRVPGLHQEGANDAEIERIRERLAVLYGDRAQLAFRSTAQGSEALLEIPYAGR